MKILHVLSAMGLYGKEQVVLNLAAVHTSQGHEVSICNLSDSDVFNHAAKHFNLIPMCCAKNIKDLANIINQGQYDIIHTHCYKSGIMINACRILRKISGVKIIRTMHRYCAPTIFSKLFLNELLDQALLKINDVIVSCGDSADVVRSNLVIRNGIKPIFPRVTKTTAIYNMGRHHVSPETKVICSAVRLAPEKNVEGMIRGVAQYIQRGNNDVVYYIYGEGPLKCQLAELISSLGMEGRIFLMGFTPNFAREILPGVDVYLQATHSEGLPISLLQAMSMSIPCIASYVDGMRYLIDQGYVMAPKLTSYTPEDIADSIEYMIHQEMLGFVGDRGYVGYLTEFTAENMANQYMENAYLDI